MTIDLECPNCGYHSSSIEAEISRLRSALQSIYDDVPKLDIHFQGAIAVQIASAVLFVDEQNASEK